MSIEAMKQGVEAFCICIEALRKADSFAAVKVSYEAIDALRQAIAQAEKQEPVAYLCENAVGHKYFRWKKPTSHYKPIALYTAPPKRQWVGLTDDDVDWILGLAYAHDTELVKTVETKLKDKNG
jgi:hypothetical protein